MQLIHTNILEKEMKEMLITTQAFEIRMEREVLSYLDSQFVSSVELVFSIHPIKIIFSPQQAYTIDSKKNLIL